MTPRDELSRFAHALRHDIRNYLAAIEGYAYLLQDEIDQDLDYIERITKNAKLIGATIDKAVDYADAGLEITNPLLVDLNQIIKSIKKSMSSSIVWDIQNLSPVQGDHQKIMHLFELLFNFLSNYSKEPINLSIKETKNDTSVRLLICNKTKDQIKDLEPQNKLFESPQTFKQDFNLKVALKLTEAHGWILQYNRVEENSYCFDIEIPTNK